MRQGQMVLVDMNDMNRKPADFCKEAAGKFGDFMAEARFVRRIPIISRIAFFKNPRFCFANSLLREARQIEFSP
jgi:hypothetical protein